jgi:hypothetical protein
MADFMSELHAVARPVNDGCLAFVGSDGTCRGFLQLLPTAGRAITIHRLWTLTPGGGNGSWMLRTLCTLADKYQVEIRLKVLPFGRKPHAMTRDQLVAWYGRHGFVGNRRKMIRKPQAPEAAESLATDGAQMHTDKTAN